MADNALNSGGPPPEAPAKPNPNARERQDPRVPSGIPGSMPGPKTIAGRTVTAMTPPRERGKAEMAPRAAHVAHPTDSGIQQSMGALADKLHPAKRRNR